MAAVEQQQCSSTEQQSTDRHSYMARRSIAAADVCLQKENFGRAFAHMLLALKLTPDIKDDVKTKFAIVFQEWCKELEEQGRMEDVFNCYGQACDAFPDCEPMLNSMGSQLFRLGYVDEAASCFRKALRIDPEYLGARENLENICGHLVERWHFRMLNDRKRNEAYQNAIERAVKKGYTSILDIGSGTGLLSMYAVQAGGDSVYACEVSKAMYELSCDIISANGMSDKISLIHKKSTQLEIGKDIPDRAKLVVTEIVDAGLLGEQILPTLNHAWKELLLSPGWFTSWGGGRVIPSSAIVYVCAIESEDIRTQHRLVYPAMRHLDLSSVTTTSNTFVMGDNYEPYSCEKLEQLRNGYKRLSAVNAVCEIDFNSPQAISDYMNGRTFNLNMTMICSGKVDAFAMWFDLELDDVTMICTAPESNTCWQQAIYPVQQKHLRTSNKRENFSVRTGDLLEVECVSSPCCLEFFCRNIVRFKTGSATPETGCNATPTGTTPTGSSSPFIPTMKNIVNLVDAVASESPISDRTPSINDVEIDIESPSSNVTNVGAIEFCRSIGDEINADFTASIEEHTHGIANLSFVSDFTVPIVYSGPPTSHMTQSQQQTGHMTPSQPPTSHMTLSQQQTSHMTPSQQQTSHMTPSQQQTSHMTPSQQQTSHMTPSQQQMSHMTPSQPQTGHMTPSQPPTSHMTQSQQQTGHMTPSQQQTSHIASSRQQMSHMNPSQQQTGHMTPSQQQTSHMTPSQQQTSHMTPSPQQTSHMTPSQPQTSQIVDGQENDNHNAALIELYRKPENRSFFQPPDLHVTDRQVYLLDPNDISCLNDIYCNKAYCEAIQKIVNSKISNTSDLSMIDMCQGVSLLGLQAIMIGVNNVLITDYTDESKAFVLSIAAANGIAASRIVFGNRNFDEFEETSTMLLTDLVEPCGALRQQILEDIALARITCLRNGGIVMPNVVTVHGMLISSAELEEDSGVVNDDRVLGLDIAKYMNDFQMTTHVDIDLFTLPHVRLSQPFKLFDLMLNEPSVSGCIPSFLEQRQVFNVETSECGHVTAVLYWFEFELADKVNISTLDKNSHWKLAAVMQKNDLDVSSGQTLTVKAVLKNSCIDIKVEKYK
ncbi:protein arginine N-methyltransferase 9-like [Tubulanus polymorphus]|uniref:protein arginine N-methyltransferase 9-like n=1 Tax=Tubulanus polymorphus TaxID=672921 RepID=UPI003DA62610